MRSEVRATSSAEGIGPVTAARPLGAVLEFLRALWGLNHALESASRRMKGRLGVTGPERMVVRLVGRSPRISAGHLARILQVHPSTLTGLLKRLVARGILARTADAADARRASPASARRASTPREASRFRRPVSVDGWTWRIFARSPAEIPG